MTSNVSATAATNVDTIRVVKRGRAFENAVNEFVRILRIVPDGTPDETSARTIRAIQQLAETVIQQIEVRLAGGDDSDRLKQRLAKDVYAIRGALEEANRWRRHFAGR